MPPIVLDGLTGITTPGLTNTGTETLVNLTTTGNTILGDASTDTLNVGNGGLIKDASGNLGLGVTPSAWGSRKALEVGNAGSALFSVGANQNYLTSNSYFDGAFKYGATGTATAYQQYAGTHAWLNAVSGSAGGVITFTQAMTLDASNRLMVGSTSAFGAVTGEISVKATSGGAGVAMWDSGIGAKYQLIAGATGANAFGLYDLSASAYRWVVDASGNLGIGTTSPTARLHAVSSSSEVVKFIRDNTGNASGGITFGNNTRVWTLYGDNSALSFWDTTASAERMRIDSSGNLLVGTTSALAKIQLLQATNSTGAFFYKSDTGTAAVLALRHDGATGATSRTMIEFGSGSGGSIVGTISSTGSATAYNTSSDYRLKNTIAPMTGALAKVAQLKPVTYKWNTDGSDGEGFIAHELAEVVPQCVTGEKDAMDAEGKPVYQGIDTSFLVATLTAAIQEQQALIQSLTDRLTALENK